jgi:ketosteroid isomerase-like protein
MTRCLSPEEVLRKLMQGIADREFATLHELYAENCIVEHPFALPVRHRTEGREAIRQHFANFATAPVQLRISNMVVHTTADPEVVVAEWDYEGVVTTTGRAFRVSNVLVTRVRNGEIVDSRDYHNHAVMAALLGRLPAVVAGLSEGPRVD